MRQTKGTFILAPETLKRLQIFSRRSGISQSALVDQILAKGLAHLEQTWLRTGAILDEAFSGNGGGRSSRKVSRAIQRESGNGRRNGNGNGNGRHSNRGQRA